MPTRKRKPKATPPFVSRADVITAQMAHNSISLKQLAQMAGLSYRTANKAKVGWHVSDDVLASVASALHLDYHLLRRNPERHPPPTLITNQRPSQEDAQNQKKEPRGLANVHVTAPPYEILSREKALQNFVQAMRNAMQAADEVIMMHVKRGSTIITLSMTYDDIHRLCSAFVARRLEPLGITSVWIEPVKRELHVLMLPAQPDLTEALVRTSATAHIILYEANTVDEAMNMHAALRPDVVIIDARRRGLRAYDDPSDISTNYLRLTRRLERLGTTKFFIRTNEGLAQTYPPVMSEHAMGKTQTKILVSRIRSLVATSAI